MVKHSVPMNLPGSSSFSAMAADKPWTCADREAPSFLQISDSEDVLISVLELAELPRT